MNRQRPTGRGVAAPQDDGGGRGRGWLRGGGEERGGGLRLPRRSSVSARNRLRMLPPYALSAPFLRNDHGLRSVSSQGLRPCSVPVFFSAFVMPDRDCRVAIAPRNDAGRRGFGRWEEPGAVCEEILTSRRCGPCYFPPLYPHRHLSGDCGLRSVRLGIPLVFLGSG